MRLIVAAVIVASSTIATADTPRALPELAKPKLAPSKSLAAAEVATQMRFLDNDINDCYAAVASAVPGTGTLEIKLSIHRTGLLDAIDVATTGLPAGAAKKLTACVKATVEGTAFPARKAPTVAVVPYKWQRTVTPGSGPQLSCWNPRGCM